MNLTTILDYFFLSSQLLISSFKVHLISGDILHITIPRTTEGLDNAIKAIDLPPKNFTRLTKRFKNEQPQSYAAFKAERVPFWGNNNAHKLFQILYCSINIWKRHKEIITLGNRSDIPWSATIGSTDQGQDMFSGLIWLFMAPRFKVGYIFWS